MLLMLVVAACVAPAAQEWVEITQQHYRKPSKIHVQSTGVFFPASEEINDAVLASYPTDEKKKPSDDVPYGFYSNDGRRKPDDDVSDTLHLNDGRRKPNDNDPHKFYPNNERRKPNDHEPYTFHPNDEKRKPNDDNPLTFHQNNDIRKPDDAVPHVLRPNDERRQADGDVPHILRPNDENRQAGYDMAQTLYSSDESRKPHDDVTHNFHSSDEKNNTNNDDTDYPILNKQNVYEGNGKYKEKISNRIYINHSISEHNWNIDQNDNIRRYTDHSKIRPNYRPKINSEYGEEIQTEPERVTSSYSNKLNDKEVFSATIERVANKVGSVKRVQLSNTPVKSPSIAGIISHIDRDDANIIPSKHGPTFTDNEFSDEFDIKAEILPNSNKQKDYISPIKHENNIFSDTKETSMKEYDIMSTTTSKPEIIFQKYAQIHRFVNKNNANNNFRDKEDISYAEESRVSSANINTNPTFSTKHDKMNNKETIKNEIPNIDTKSDKINKLEENKGNVDPKSNISKVLKIKPNVKTNSKSENDRNEEIKANTMENIMKFIKVVADTISKNTNRGVNGKVKYLNDLKGTLLSSIQSRIEATWPDDTSGAARRLSRSSRGHVEFPSSESSLMTISFLTFAVFLIKLILQVIQTYKNKAMMVAPLVVATAGRTMPKQHNFH